MKVLDVKYVFLCPDANKEHVIMLWNVIVRTNGLVLIVKYVRFFLQITWKCRKCCKNIFCFVKIQLIVTIVKKTEPKLVGVWNPISACKFQISIQFLEKTTLIFFFCIFKAVLMVGLVKIVPIVCQWRVACMEIVVNTLILVNVKQILKDIFVINQFARE